MGHSLKTSIQRTKYLAIWLKTGVVAEYLSFKAPNNLAPNYIRAKFTMSSDIYNAGTRNANHNLILPKVRTSMAKMLSGFQQRGAGMSSQKTSKRPSSIPWALLPVLENFHHSFSRPDWLPLGLRRCIDFGLLRYNYFESKTVIFLGFVPEKKICSLPCQQQDTENLARFARAKATFRKFGYSVRAVLEKGEVMQKSGLHE